MISTKEYIRSIIKAKSPTLDTSDGSPIAELFLNPSASMLDPVMMQLKYLLDNLGLTDPEKIHPDELDAIAANYLVYRNLGTPAAGYIEMLYDTPQSLLIPANTIFKTADGIEFYTTTAIQVMSTAMQGNIWKYPLFSTGLIPVASVSEAEVVVNPGDIVETDFEPAPIAVTNPTAFTLGSETETNTELAERLVEAVVNRSLASSKSINAFVNNLFPSIMETIVIGAGDDRMIRDLFYSGIEALQNYQLVDYNGKVSTSDFFVTGSGGFYTRTSGLFDAVPDFDQYPYPQSKAYYALFYDDPTSSGIIPDLPRPDEFSVQFNTSQYANLYYLNDAYKTILQSTILLDDPFVGGTLDPRWVLGDVHFGTNLVKSAYEIQSTSQGVRLGYTPDQASLSQQPVTMSRTFVQLVRDTIWLASNMTPLEAKQLDVNKINTTPAYLNNTNII
jgi:hypothetical protein